MGLLDKALADKAVIEDADAYAAVMSKKQAAEAERKERQATAEFVCKLLDTQVTADEFELYPGQNRRWRFEVDGIRFEAVTLKQRFELYTLMPRVEGERTIWVRSKRITRLADLLGEGER